MKKIIVNIGLSILFTLSIIASVFSITILNDDYIKYIFKKYDIYTNISNSISNTYENNNILVNFDTDEVVEDVNKYISSRYDNTLKLDIEDEHYLKHVFFINNDNIKKYSYIIYGITILLIIITGNLFNHSKKLHNLDIIFLISSLSIILITGYIYIFVSLDNYIYAKVLDVTNHILLGVGIFIFELVFLKYANILIHKYIKK